MSADEKLEPDFIFPHEAWQVAGHFYETREGAQEAADRYSVWAEPKQPRAWVPASALEASEAREAALAAENATLREVLKPFAERANFNGLSQVVSLGACQRARAALRQEGKP